MPESEIQFETIAIVGVGLIGGSIALAARERGICKSVIGVGRNPQRLQHAIDLGVIDESVTSCSELVGVDLVIVCTPVDRIVEDVRTCFASTPESTLITDAGSVKSNICREIHELPNSAERFIGSHPLAGSHQSGFENADASLYANRKCVLTPWEDSSKHLIEAMSQFWSRLGMQVHSLSPEEHDRILGLTSHLPHLGASAIAGLIDDVSVDFAATGFRDTTRVAAGAPGLWGAIFSDNSEQVIEATEQLIETLKAYQNALVANDRAALTDLLRHAQTHRQLFEERQKRD